MKFHLDTPLIFLLVLIFPLGYAAGPDPNWIMPSKFSFDDTAPFWWRIQPGTNILSMFVRPEAAPNTGWSMPREYFLLRLR